MSNVLNNLKIYCAYHDKQIFDDYNLYESNIIKPYYLLDENIFDDWLIKNNSILSEFQLMLYIYDHNIKSEYVGFCHYRRFWNYVDIEQLEKTGLIFWMANCGPCAFSKDSIQNVEIFNFYLQSFNNFVFNNYKELWDDYQNLLNGNSKYYNFFAEMFIARWDIFLKVIGFLKHYLFYTFGDKLKNIESCYKLNGFWDRSLACFLELMIMLTFNLFYKLDNISDYNMCGKNQTKVCLIYTGKEELDNWIKKQYSIGLSEIIIFNECNEDISNIIEHYYNCTSINNYYNKDNFESIFLKHNIFMPQNCIIFRNNEYLCKDEIIQYQNELWNNKEITNKKIIKS